MSGIGPISSGEVNPRNPAVCAGIPLRASTEEPEAPSTGWPVIGEAIRHRCGCSRLHGRTTQCVVLGLTGARRPIFTQRHLPHHPPPAVRNIIRSGSGHRIERSHSNLWGGFLIPYLTEEDQHSLQGERPMSRWYTGRGQASRKSDTIPCDGDNRNCSSEVQLSNFDSSL